MYPTVCTLMRLWDFVTAKGMTWRETTIELRGLLEKVAFSDLQRPEFWSQLHTLVQVQPDAYIFPVRAQYTDDPKYTIGLNYLTSDFPMWFTLADCIAAKLLTGKSPKVIRAYTFAPGKLQSKLWPVNIMGNPDYRVDPAKDDFYRRMIDLRIAVREQERRASSTEKTKFDTEQLALKIFLLTRRVTEFSSSLMSKHFRASNPFSYLGLPERPNRLSPTKSKSREIIFTLWSGH